MDLAKMCISAKWSILKEAKEQNTKREENIFGEVMQ